MNNLQLDCALSYLNEGKVINPIELLSEQISYEINQFNSFMESDNIINEKVDVKSIFEKIKKLIHDLLEKIKLAIRSLRGKFAKAKRNKKEESESSSIKDVMKKEKKLYTYNETIIKYNNIEYTESDFNKLISTIITQLGDNHLVNIISRIDWIDINGLKDAFENFKEYEPHKKFNSELTKAVTVHQNLASSERDMYLSEYNNINNTIKREYEWAYKMLSRWNKSLTDIQNENTDDARYRASVMTYMLNRINQYILILSKIENFYLN